jgi:uncharacterized protein YdeI (YjbR/CyaY-like superfamily)
MQSTKTVEGFIEKQTTWKEPLVKFREILLATELEESVKWGQPVYALDGKNVLGMGAFKSYVGIWFYQGVFMKDPQDVLINAQEGKTKALRQLRFSSLEEIDYALVQEYVNEAISNQKAGKELKADKKKLLKIPEELQNAFDNDSDLEALFAKFTPGRQREFADYISEAKREATRLDRVKKCVTMIRKGIGLNDKYKK